MLPSVARKATRSSPRMRTRTGGASHFSNSHDSKTGCQYLRKVVPMGVPGPTRTSRSLSSCFSILRLPLLLKPLFRSHIRHGAFDQWFWRAIERCEYLRDLFARRRVDREIL